MHVRDCRQSVALGLTVGIALMSACTAGTASSPPMVDTSVPPMVQSEPEPETKLMTWFGRTCFVEPDGAPVAHAIARFVPAGRVIGPREYTDAEGCLETSGMWEGMYTVSIEGREGENQLYLADGDSILVRLGAPHGSVEYPGGPSPSSLIVELATDEARARPEHAGAVERALRFPAHTRIRVVGLLASFALQGDWARGDAPQWQNRSRDDARALLLSLPPDSPLLTAWPTAPIGAALTLGISPREHPVVADMVARDPLGPVAGSLLLYEFHAARARGDEDRAQAIIAFLRRVRVFQPYAVQASATQAG